MKGALLIASVCLVVVGLCWVAWGICRDKVLESGFTKVRLGDSESEVVRQLGRPKRVEHCGEFMGPLTKAEMEACVREYFYASPFAPLLPKYYVVRFDANNRVSSTAPYSSP